MPFTHYERVCRRNLTEEQQDALLEYAFQKGLGKLMLVKAIHACISGYQDEIAEYITNPSEDDWREMAKLYPARVVVISFSFPNFVEYVFAVPAPL